MEPNKRARTDVTAGATAGSRDSVCFPSMYRVAHEHTVPIMLKRVIVASPRFVRSLRSAISIPNLAYLECNFCGPFVTCNMLPETSRRLLK